MSNYDDLTDIEALPGALVRVRNLFSNPIRGVIADLLGEHEEG
jgi:hypothetical protein